MNKRIFKRVLITTIGLMIFILCSSCKEAHTNNEKHNTLTISNGKSFISDEFFNKLKEKYPEINFEISHYSGNNYSGFTRKSLENGDIPDIYVSSQPFSKESQKKYLVDLSGYKFINNYTTTSLSLSENNGEIYLLPTTMQLTGISYNKTLLEELGLELPNSFEELKELAPRIEAKGIDVMRAKFDLDGYPFNYFFNIGNTKYLSTVCGKKWKEEFVEGKSKATDNIELLNTANYFKKWVDEGFIKESDLDTVNEPYDAFLNGECVFYLSLGITDYEHTTKDGNKYEFGVMPWLSANGDNNMLVTNVERFFGINKELTKKGNEQKYEDALKVMEFLSTTEGQKALVADHEEPFMYTTSLKESAVDKKSPFYGMKDLVEQGNLENMVYLGWDKLIIKMARDIKRFIKDDISAKELLKEFDNSYKEAKNNVGEDVLAKAKHNMTIEDTARICGISVTKAANVDVALVSHGAYDRKTPNPYGVNWYFYKGNVDVEVVNMFATTSSSLSVIEMKGADIKKLVKKGFCLYEDKEPFKYSVFVKNDEEIKDNKTYKVVAGTDEFTKDLQKKAKIIEISTKDAICEYVKTLGEFSSKDIEW